MQVWSENLSVSQRKARLSEHDQRETQVMAVRRPTLDQLRSVAEDLGMHMGDEELKSYDALMQANYAAYEAVDAMPDYVPAVKYPRTPGYRPEGEENKYNAWYVKTEIKGAPSGKLAGKKIALKDNISLAGVPMMNGASTLEGYIPDIDATIVTRMLDAGGTIVGKVHCEYFCFSGGSHTCAAGPVHNPTRWATPPAARHRAAPSWWRPGRLIWRSAAIRAGRFAFPRRSAASTA
jgi:Asp-tRNA(Asn)/Glu-tRNA(Gln) amidotransferase A subunit family amidase